MCSSDLERRAVLDAIWPETLPAGVQTFAILDGAQDDRISWEMQSTFCEHDCLYAGDLPRELERAAPYVVQLDRDDRLTKFILENGWGCSWGLFMRTDVGLKALRKHLRGFLRVKDERGHRLLFRYYDPRVFQVYLPTCTVGELKTVFGPVQSFLMEAADSEQVLEAMFDGKALHRRNFSLGVTGKVRTATTG